MKNWFEIKVFQLAKYLIIKGYGTCKTKDYDDFPTHPRDLNAQGRCPSCQAKEVCDWIEGHIALIKS